MPAVDETALIGGQELALPRGESGRGALDVARRCSAVAGEMLRQIFEEGTAAVEWKGERNPVTRADTETEQAVMSLLGEEFPAHAVLAEESGGTIPAGWLWVIDPLDGTRNFASGVPHFAFNLALCHDGAPVLGLTLDPMLEEEFVAVRGRGATLNGEPIRASNAGGLNEAVVGAGLGYEVERAAALLVVLRELWDTVQALRICGSAALDIAYAAAGRFDLFVHSDVYPWDIAPGIVLIEEAGGRITTGALPEDPPGAITIESRNLVAGGAAVHADFSARRATIQA
jgi:myo-inositol-1(or 4)-monophosphatase